LFFSVISFLLVVAPLYSLPLSVVLAIPLVAGLDSLDAVEVGMALEDEFGIEIPDNEADKIQSVPDAIKYISANPKAQ
jgi:hypothetical protein